MVPLAWIRAMRSVSSPPDTWGRAMASAQRTVGPAVSLTGAREKLGRTRYIVLASGGPRRLEHADVPNAEIPIGKMFFRVRRRQIMTCVISAGTPCDDPRTITLK